MLREFESIGLQSVGLGEILLSLTVALVCGFVISLIYRWTYRGSSYSPSFVRSMIFLAMITAVVMMVIGNNLARAFGLVGAMSIIRFRTAVKDAQDIVFIFFSLAVGLAAGVGLHLIALASTLFIGFVVAVTAKANYGAVNRQSFVLQLSYDAPQHNGEATYIPVLERYCKRHKLINAKAVGSGETLDLMFYVDLRRKAEHKELTYALKQAPHVNSVNLFYDEEQA